MWHASISIRPKLVDTWSIAEIDHARRLAVLLLTGRGDANHWDVEMGQKALHVRRKISDAEKRVIGPAQVSPGRPSE